MGVICEPGKIILSVIRGGIDAVEPIVEFEDATTSFGGIGAALGYSVAGLQFSQVCNDVLRCV